jgi:tRNA(fMet)-specific endonuclease VapC
VLSIVPVETYDLGVARTHARLLAHPQRSGRARGAHDLLIAATALDQERTVVTVDAAGFDELPGVSVRSTARRN